MEYSATQLLDSNVQRCYNGGYLFLEKIYYELGIDKICEKISKKYKFEYDLNEILEMLLLMQLWIVYLLKQLSQKLFQKKELYSVLLVKQLKIILI